MIVLNNLLKSLLDTDNPDIRSMISEVCYVHQSKTLPVVLEEMHFLGKFPKPDESFSYKNLAITIAETDDLRVTKLRVRVL
jgi:CBS domain containing-hemolysin-like protein